MTQKPQPRLPQLLTHLSLNSPRDTHTPKGPISSPDAIESSALAFFDEVFAVRRFGGDEFGDGGEGVVGVSCFVARGWKEVSWSLILGL